MKTKPIIDSCRKSVVMSGRDSHCASRLQVNFYFVLMPPDGGGESRSLAVYTDRRVNPPPESACRVAGKPKIVRFT